MGVLANTIGAVGVLLLLASGVSPALGAGSDSSTGSEGAGSSAESNKGGKFYKKAKAEIAQQRYRTGIEELKKALKADQNNADYWSLYGFAARKAGSHALAEKAYERALRLQPDHLGALEYSAELFLETGRRAAAEGRLKRLRELCPQGCEELSLLQRALQGEGNSGQHKW